jgi:hypothetical protein
VVCVSDVPPLRKNGCGFLAGAQPAFSPASPQQRTFMPATHSRRYQNRSYYARD